MDMNFNELFIYVENDIKRAERQYEHFKAMCNGKSDECKIGFIQGICKAFEHIIPFIENSEDNKQNQISLLKEINFQLQDIQRKCQKEYIKKDIKKTNETIRIKKRVKRSIEKLIDKDEYLLNVDANERSITHKLEEYLQQEFPTYDVDCEYNRDVDNKNNIKEIEIKEKKKREVKNRLLKITGRTIAKLKEEFFNDPEKFKTIEKLVNETLSENGII